MLKNPRQRGWPLPEMICRPRLSRSVTRWRRQHALPCLLPVCATGQVGLGVHMPIWSDIHTGRWIVLNGRYRRRCRGRRRSWRCTRSRPRCQLRDILSRPRCVRITLPIEAVVERNVLLVAFAQLHCRGPLARPRLTRIVTRTAHPGDVRVLRYPAIEVTFRNIWGVLVAGGPLLLDRQESGGTWRRKVQVQVEAQKA